MCWILPAKVKKNFDFSKSYVTGPLSICLVMITTRQFSIIMEPEFPPWHLLLGNVTGEAATYWWASGFYWCDNVLCIMTLAGGLWKVIKQPNEPEFMVNTKWWDFHESFLTLMSHTKGKFYLPSSHVWCDHEVLNDDHLMMKIINAFSTYSNQACWMVWHGLGYKILTWYTMVGEPGKPYILIWRHPWANMNGSICIP